jgi:toxin-antitoxin system PIN domain toxin
MIAVDTNLLIFAHREDSEFHEPALARLTELAGHGAPWAIPWPCLHEFLAITTHPRIYDPPSPPEVALSSLQTWIEHPNCRLLAEGPGYWDGFQKLLRAGRAVGPLVHDARIAALCLHHGVRELWSADRDFTRFGALRVRNPLVS